MAHFPRKTFTTLVAVGLLGLVGIAPQARAAEVVPVGHQDVRVNYLGVWKTSEGGGGTGCHQTERDGDFFEYTFLGTGIGVRADKGPEMGSAVVSLDGKPAGAADCKTAQAEPGALVYRSPQLPYGLHTIKGAKKTGARIGLCGFDVEGVRVFRETAGDTFQDRVRKMKASATYNFKNDMKLGLLYAAAYFDAGKDREALELIKDFIAKIPKIKGVNNAFAQWPVADVYLRYYNKLTPEMRNALAERLKSDRSFNWVSTGNLFAMTAIPYYLATEQFGVGAMSEPFTTANYHKKPFAQCEQAVCQYWRSKGLDWSAFHDGKGRAVFLPLNGSDKIYDYIPGHDPTARKYIENVMIGDVVKEGLMEYNCWPYGADNIGPYLTLIDNTKDRALAKKAAIAYETILASTAANWLGGHWAAAQGRSYPNVFNQRPFCGVEIFWPYFGGAPDAQPGATYFPLFVFASRYRMPEYIAGAAQNRSGEYVSKTNFMGRKQYTYMNRRYAVYSQFDKGVPTDFNPRFGIVPQSKRSGIVWEGVGGATVLWIDHQLYDGKGTSGYGTSDRCRNTQYKGTLVQTYNITRDPKIFDGKAELPNHQNAIACVPTNYLAVINDGAKGRIFFCFKNVMVAVTSSVPFNWTLTAATGKKGIQPVSFNAIPGNQFGVAMETASPDEYPGGTPQQQLEAFRKNVLAKSNPEYDPRTLTMTYTDRSGVAIHAGFDGFPSKVNGGIVDQEQWPEIANPWIAQPAGGNLTFYDGPDKYVYDYANWEVKRGDARESSR